VAEPAISDDPSIETSGIEIPATLLDVRTVGDWLTDLATARKLPSEIVPQMELALVELCNNIVTHGYANVGTGVADDRATGYRIWLETSMISNDVLVSVIDQAPPYDLETATEPDPEEPTVHGYGIMILRQLAEEFWVESTDDGNRWHLLFRLPGSTT